MAVSGTSRLSRRCFDPRGEAIRVTQRSSCDIFRRRCRDRLAVAPHQRLAFVHLGAGRNILDLLHPVSERMEITGAATLIELDGTGARIMVLMTRGAAGSV